MRLLCLTLLTIACIAAMVVDDMGYMPTLADLNIWAIVQDW